MQVAEMLGKLFDQPGWEFLRGLHCAVLAAQKELRSRKNPMRCCILFCLEGLSYFVWNSHCLLSVGQPIWRITPHFPFKTMSSAQSNISAFHGTKKMHGFLVLDVSILSLVNCAITQA